MLFAPVYIHFVSSAALKVAVVVTCCGVLLWIAVGHGAACDKLLWICACVFTGFGFVAYVVLNPLAKAHRKRQPSVACLDTGGNV
ncbi:MAG: hypothetical protein ACRDVE_05640 [Actinocrinis sp.]